MKIDRITLTTTLIPIAIICAFLVICWLSYKPYTNHVLPASLADLQTVEYDGHWSITRTRGVGGIIHHPDCPKCKEK